MTDDGKTEALAIEQGYRKLMCAVIWQAVQWANGVGLSGSLENLNPNSNYFKQEKKKEIKEAQKFIFSKDFVYYCELLGIDDSVEAIRSKVLRPSPFKFRELPNKKKNTIQTKRITNDIPEITYRRQTWRRS